MPRVSLASARGWERYHRPKGLSCYGSVHSTRRFSRVCRKRKRHMKPAALAGLALHTDSPSMLFDKELRNRETEASSFMLADRRGQNLVKRLGHRLLLLMRDSEAGIDPGES